MVKCVGFLGPVGTGRFGAGTKESPEETLRDSMASAPSAPGGPRAARVHLRRLAVTISHDDGSGHPECRMGLSALVRGDGDCDSDCDCDSDGDCDCDCDCDRQGALPPTIGNLRSLSYTAFNFLFLLLNFLF